MVLSGLRRFLLDVGQRGVEVREWSAEIPPCKCGSKRDKGLTMRSGRHLFPVHT